MKISAKRLIHFCWTYITLIHNLIILLTLIFFFYISVTYVRFSNYIIFPTKLIRTKKDQIIEQLSHFNYFRNDIGYVKKYFKFLLFCIMYYLLFIIHCIIYYFVYEQK